MKVGSIVICVKFAPAGTNSSTGVKSLRPKQPYTVRAIINDGEGLYLEEVINPISTDERFRQAEVGYYGNCFRELLPPMEIQNALDECEPVLIELK